MMSDWMKNARARARELDQSTKKNSYKERLHLAGESARKNGLAPQPVQTASSAIKPVETKIGDPMAGLHSKESYQYLMSDNLKTDIKAQYEESVKAEQDRYNERIRWVNEKKQEQETEKYNERMRWVSEAMAKQEEANKQEIANTSDQIDDLYTQLEIQSAALQAGDISKDTFDEMNLQGRINDLMGEKLDLEKRGREMQDRRWNFDNSQSASNRQQYVLNYDVAQGGIQLENLEGKQADLQAQIASLDEQLAGYNNLGMTAEAQAVMEERKRLSDQLDFYEQQATKIRGENTQAAYVQTDHDYMSLLNAPDFDFYAARGSLVRNPSYEDLSKKWGNKEKYIGNIVTFSQENRDTIAANEIAYGDAIGSSLYLRMTEDEVAIYNYLLAKEGRESAQKYLEHLTEKLNARQGYEEGKRVRSIEDNTARILATGMYGLGAGVDQFAGGIRQRFSGEKLPTSPTQYGSQYIRGNLANVGPEILGNSAGQLLYDGTVETGNLLPSVLVSSVLGPTAGSVSMGLSASGNAYGQALAQGYSKHQANQYSFAIGASEAVLQYLLGGIGKLGKGATGKLAALIGKIDNAWLRMAANGTLNIFKEFNEELLQAELEPVYRNMIFGENNKFEPFSEDKIYQALLGALVAMPGAFGNTETAPLIKNGIMNPDVLRIVYGAETNHSDAGITIPPEQFRQMQINYAKEHGWKTDWDALEQVFFRLGLEMGYGDGLDVNNGQGGELHLSREQVKELSDMYNEGVYQLFRDVLKENAPSTLEEFSQIRYDNGEAWQQLKKQYEVVERYETRGDVPVDQIIELDEIAYHNKTESFDYSKFHGRDRERVKKLTKEGNAAIMELGGKHYFSHSRAEKAGTLVYNSYSGKYPLIGLSANRIFKTKDLGDGKPRHYDTEAKFLEYVASIKTNRLETFTVTILSEKHICESCEFVVEQFKELFPNATVNIISGNPNYGEVNAEGKQGLKTWKYRKD